MNSALTTNIFIPTLPQMQDKKLETICLTGSIIAEDGTADVQSRAIIESFFESGEFLDRWCATTKDMHANHPDLNSMLDEIPSADTLCPTKMLGGMISGDNCPAAMKTRNNLADHIIELGKEKGYSGDELKIYTGNCHQHVRNVWVGAVCKMMNRKLTQLLKHDLSVIPSHLRVKCDILNIERCIDKAFNGTANYKKGDGDRFMDAMRKKHPGTFLMPVVRVLGGNRQDAQFEAALPAYYNRPKYVEFLHDDLCTTENILLTNLFIILESVEMIAQLRIGSIFFMAIIVPARWLAANTHKLSHRNWGERSMGKVIDILYQSMLEIAQDGTKGMDEDYIMNIFLPIEEELPEFKAYLEWYFEEKVSNLIDTSSKEDRVLGIDLAKAETFFPKRSENRQSTEMCVTLWQDVSRCMCIEFTDTRKATSEQLSAILGCKSWSVISEEEKEACLGMRANNDPAEQNFAVFSDALEMGGRIDIETAAGKGQTRYNHDFNRNHQQLVTGRKSKEKTNDDGECPGIGLFHELCTELQDSLVVTGKRHAETTRNNFAKALCRQRVARAEKAKIAKDKKLKSSQRDLIEAMCLWEQYHSPACWNTAADAFRQYGKLTTKAGRLKKVKEQILMRYLGLGWDNAYHPWSKDKRQFTPGELLEHLTMIVIPLKNKLIVPEEAPVDMPTRQKMATLGTKAYDVIELDKNNDSAETRMRLDAIKERERLEDNGYGDRLQDYQASMPIFKNDELKAKPFRIEMLFDYKDNDEGGSTLVWAQGNVIELVKEKSKNIWIVKVKWDDNCVNPGEQSITNEELRRKNWNPDTQVEGVWREDLRHLIGNLHQQEIRPRNNESNNSVGSEDEQSSSSEQSSNSEQSSESDNDDEESDTDSDI